MTTEATEAPAAERYRVVRADGRVYGDRYPALTPAVIRSLVSNFPCRVERWDAAAGAWVPVPEEVP